MESYNADVMMRDCLKLNAHLLIEVFPSKTLLQRLWLFRSCRQSHPVEKNLFLFSNALSNGGHRKKMV